MPSENAKPPEPQPGANPEFDFSREQLVEWVERGEKIVAERHGFQTGEPLAENAVFLYMASQTARRSLFAQEDQRRFALMAQGFLPELIDQGAMSDRDVAEGVLGHLLLRRSDFPEWERPAPNRLLGCSVVFAIVVSLNLLLFEKIRVFVFQALATPWEHLFALVENLGAALFWAAQPGNFIHLILLSFAVWVGVALVVAQARKTFIAYCARRARFVFESQAPWRVRLRPARLAVDLAKGLAGAGLIALVLVVAGACGFAAYWVAEFLSPRSAANWAPGIWGLVVSLCCACWQFAWLDSPVWSGDDPVEGLAQAIGQWRESRRQLASEEKTSA
jgi:hypothetical protein